MVKDVHYRGINDPRLDVYEPAAQTNAAVQYLVVRAAGDPLALTAAIEAQVRAFDHRAVISGIATLEAIVSTALASWRFTGWLFTLFALLAFLLAMVGLVGLVSVVSLDVAQRSHEFALRMALGADSRQIGRRVLASAAVRAVSGIALGLIAAAVGMRWIRNLLFEVNPLDPGSYAVVVAVVCLVVLGGSAFPARRAAAIDPLTLLKRD